MPFIRSLASVYYTLLTASISLNSKIMSPYSHCVKKGLVYITIITPFSRQPSSCSKCTKANIYSLCNMHLVSTNKYIFWFCWCYWYLSGPSQLLNGRTWWCTTLLISYCVLWSLQLPYLSCLRVLGVIHY